MHVILENLFNIACNPFPIHKLIIFCIFIYYQMSSAAAKAPAPGQAVYSASKYAVNGYFHTLRSEVCRLCILSSAEGLLFTMINHIVVHNWKIKCSNFRPMRRKNGYKGCYFVLIIMQY